MPSKPLRYAILMSRPTCPYWQELCLSRLLECEGAVPVMVIRADKGHLAKKARLDRGGRLWRLIRRIDRWLYPPIAWKQGHLPQKIAELPLIECALELRGTYSYHFAAPDIDAIRRAELDFIIAFLAFDIIRGEALRAARYGIWSYHCGDPENYRGTPPGVWEIHDGAARSGAMLQRLTERLDAGVVLRQDSYPTIAYSMTRNADSLFLRSAGWVAEACRQVMNGDLSAVEGAPSSTSAPIRQMPGNRHAVRIAFILLANNLLRPFRRSANQHGASLPP